MTVQAKKPMHPPQTNTQPDYAVLILAGGRGSRMGGVDKGLVKWGRQPLVHAVLTRLQSQTLPPSSIWISANRNDRQYAQFGATAVVKDERRDYVGPLAGIESTLRQVNSPLLLVVPCDTPLLPLDLFEALYQPMQQDASVSATYAATLPDVSTRSSLMMGTSKTDIDQHVQAHPLCSLLRTTLLADLSNYLDQDQRRVMGWMQHIDAKAVTFNDRQAFANMNDLQTLAATRSAP